MVDLPSCLLSIVNGYMECKKSTCDGCIQHPACDECGATYANNELIHSYMCSSRKMCNECGLILFSSNQMHCYGCPLYPPKNNDFWNFKQNNVNVSNPDGFTPSPTSTATSQSYYLDNALCPKCDECKGSQLIDNTYHRYNCSRHPKCNECGASQLYHMIHFMKCSSYNNSMFR